MEQCLRLRSKAKGLAGLFPAAQKYQFKPSGDAAYRSGQRGRLDNLVLSLIPNVLANMSQILLLHVRAVNVRCL